MNIRNYKRFYGKIREAVCLILLIPSCITAFADTTDTTLPNVIEFEQVPLNTENNPLFTWLSQITMMNRPVNWIIALVFLVILYFVLKKRENINDWFARIGHRAETEAFASKNSGTGTRRSPILQKYFPIRRPSWWIIAPGLLFGLMIIGGALWNAAEMEWFFSQGANLIPAGFTLPIHWVLWSLSLITALLIIALTLESFSIAGPWAGLLRLALLALLNAMAMVVLLYVLGALVVVILGIFLLIFVLSALFGRRSRT